MGSDLTACMRPAVAWCGPSARIYRAPPGAWAQLDRSTLDQSRSSSALARLGSAKVPVGLLPVQRRLLFADQLVTPLPKSAKARNTTHLRFVAEQPCLVCQRSPCDAHHIKFAEPLALGRKVSDEFTVPLCRDHHQQLHRHGMVGKCEHCPLVMARNLWETTMSFGSNKAVGPVRVAPPDVTQGTQAWATPSDTRRCLRNWRDLKSRPVYCLVKTGVSSK